ncbi:fatty acid synthase alpha subunit Lsd1 [Coemansia sp. RSA 986]|nr:fatty acid synthase alpha subunit Lsd1 [Coemansia sp. RSA 986]
MSFSDSTVSIQHGDTKIVLQLASEPLIIQTRDASKGFDADASISTEIGVFAAFLEFCVKDHPVIAPAIMDAFAKHFGISPDVKDIHEVANEHILDKADIQRVLRAFYLLWGHGSAQHHYHRNTFSEPLSALFSSDDMHIMAMFGGQPGSSDSPLDEAAWLFDIYRFAQFMQLLVLYKTLDLKPGELVARFKGISKHDLEQYLQSFNACIDAPSKHMYLAVVNTHDNFIVAGKVSSAAKFVKYLRSQSAKGDKDQSRLPFNKRRPAIATSYLGITVPYHCSLLKSTVQPMCDIAYEKSWILDAKDMRLPVRALDDAHDIRIEEDLTRYLLESMCVLQVDWPKVVNPHRITHIVDLGPGGIAGFGYLAYRNIEGSGVPVICIGALASSSAHPHIGTKAELYKCYIDDIVTAPNWLAEFGPKLVRTVFDGQVHIDTHMHRVLGQPPVMVAGMTPTTANEAFVAAINSAGYHAEIAGGGMHTKKDMVRKLTALVEMIPPGQGITLNCIYVSQKQWSFQFPTLLRLRKEGIPIAGLCIGGGVPSFEAAMDIIKSLRSAGIYHMSFKPGNAASIRNVLRIAQANNGFSIILQWTGGRSGGHHSLEDFHQPLLETYSAIRAYNNVVLVVGSGFGDAKGTLPYITGEWSVKYGRTPMPVDGILLGSRVMVAKEAATSLKAKELIVSAPGMSDEQWSTTFNEEGSGVTAMVSEYGESNHALATRATMFINHLRSTVFSQPRNKQTMLLQERKQDIVARLNSDFFRPWFGKKRDGRVVDLDEMTYAEVIGRMVELMYVAHQKRWICESYFHCVLEFTNRIERRVQNQVLDIPISMLLYKVTPIDYATAIVGIYPIAETLVIASEDIQFLIEMWKRRGQKPFPFILVLDQDFSDLLLRDSIWQSEDLDSVVGHDPQRTSIQQGPVSARYSTVVDEPVKVILDGIYHAHIDALLERDYSSDKNLVPVVEYIGDDPPLLSLPEGVRVVDLADRRVFYLPDKSDQLPETSLWLEAVSGQKKSWLRALLTSQIAVQGSKYMPNVAQRVMRPRPNRVVTVYLHEGAPQSLEIATVDTDIPELRIIRGKSDEDILLTIYHPTTSSGIGTLDLKFIYLPRVSTTSIHQGNTQLANAEYQLYAQTWVDKSDSSKKFSNVEDPNECIVSGTLTIMQSHIDEFCCNVWNRSVHYDCGGDGFSYAPMEFLYFVGSPQVLRILSSSVFGSGKLSIVHLYQNVRYVDGVKPLCAGDRLSTTNTIDGIVNTASGKQITISIDVYREDVLIAELESAFLSVGSFVDTSRTFRKIRGRKVAIWLPDDIAVQSLEYSGWFVYCDSHSTRLSAGSQLEFVLDSEYRFQGSGLYSSVSTLGKCLAKQEDGTMLHIANIDFEWNSCAEDPVIEFLGRFRVESTTRLFKDGERLLELPPLSIDQPHIAVPDSNLEYANISGDINHIHVNPYIADVAGLPGTITHGMWTNAATRALVEIYAADSDQRRIRSFDVEFTGMVQPRDKLSVEIAHIGMDSGRMLISAKTTNFSGDVVLKCKAEVEQPKTAYVFTGQGSQTVGLGMDLYEQSNAARDVWDRAEMHMVRTYGISLLEVVRSNPSRMTIKFKSQMGFQVLDRYLDLKENALEQQIQMFLGLCHESESHEFYSPTGLLDSTAFTQPILAVFATAFVADMRSSGILQSTSIFAGHSLGEYAALASLGGGLLSVEDIMDVAFYRGLLMQSVVTRDESGFSEYGMVSVDPSRVETGFDEDKLRLVIDAICKDNADLLEIANHNVQDQQYVVSGTRFQLATMRMVLDTLASSPVSLAAEAIQQAVSRVLQSTEYATLSAIADRFDSKMLRGRATVPLDGIDVPFHSSKLLPCVAPLRRMLEKHIYPANVDVAALDGRYVPNLTGVPFVVSKEYFELVFELTQSPVLGLALEKWNNTLLTNPTDKQQAAHKLLIELLAYQVALPVQWIKTQQKLLFEEDVRRVIEIGAAPVLCGVARKIIDEQFNAFVDDVSILHIERDKDSIYYTHKSSTLSDSVGTPATHSSPADSADSSSESEKSSVAITLVASIEELPPATTTSYTGSEDAIIASAEFDDEPLTSLEVITAVIAQKFKMPYKDVKPDKSIKAMAAGNSTLQNEIVGDLHKEFSGQVPNKAEELSFQELSASIGSFNGELGKHTQTQLARLFRNKMPGGFSLASAREILQSTYSLGPHRQSGVLLHALANEPSSRLSNNDKAKEWLGDAAQQYAKSADISYSSARSGRAGAQQNALVYNSADVMELQKLQTQQQIEVLARYAGLDLREGARRAEDEQTKCVSLQSKLDKLRDELGDEFTEGVMPLFKAQMARNFDSSWNWVRQDAFEWIQQAITAVDVSEKVDPARIHRIENGADALLKSRLEGLVCTLQENKDGFNVDIALNLAQTLCKACTNALSKKPTYKEHSLPLQPTTRVLIDGQIEYKEKLRVGEATFANYVEHMRLAVQAKPTDVRSESPLPLLYLKTQSGSVDWRYDQPLSSTYHDGLKELCADGLSFAGKTALVTGCGRGSIGAEIVRGLLMGGAKVLATTSSYSRPSILFFEEMYQTYAARGAQLVVVPFNQGSAQDVKQLIDYAYDSSSGGGSNALGWDFDYIVPFAACSDNGTLATHIGPRSELAQRIMLINVIRLIGGIKTKKEKLGRVFNSSLVVLPLSPNHGTLGGDGLYGECKLGLETLLNRWKSEHWQDYISIVGTVIGWTRGTGLMSGNNILAQGVEELGVRTFSTREMAFNILGLMHSRMHKACIQKPVYADFAANLNEIKDLSMAVTQIQGKIRRQSDILVNVMSQLVRQNSVLFPNIALAQKCLPEMTPLAKHKIHIPTPKQHSELNHLHHLQDMVNLDKVVVIVGYGEVGPFGNADTRWEIEAFDDLTTEGCIELAWVMGLIKRFNGVLPSSGKAYIGWVDCKSGKPVKDVEVKPRYLDYILAHTGIRLMEPELMGGYDPHSKAAQREVQIEHDMQPFETGAEDAAAFKASNGDKVDVWPNASGTSWSVRLLKGALIRVPVAVDVDRLVAGLIPTGWSAERYGIPDYVVKQVDDTTLYMLVAVVEALLRAGITDPYELYRYFHVSEVGNSIGSGLGGGKALQDVFRKRNLEHDMQSDILQETFISTIQAWINMLLMSSAGPVKPVVGACATGLLSIDVAVETIQSGKAKVMLAGGVDDITEEPINEFASMGATSSSLKEIALGRTPKESSRPCTSTRGGFVEGHGAGAVVLMSASAAIKCGAPIYGIVAMSRMASDKQGSSVPAPGKGVLTVAQEINSHSGDCEPVPRSLDIGYRHRMIQMHLTTLDGWRQSEIEAVDESNKHKQHTLAHIERDYQRQKASIQDTWGNEFWKNNTYMSPVRGSLAVWGLSVDDIGVASFHGTSTAANDKNESSILNTQFRHLGRTSGHAVPVVCQKWLTGHSKGGAAMFMLNGVLQSLHTGIVPGNRNADNIDDEFKSNEYALYLSRTIQTAGIKAAMLTSFGFGQVGGEVLIVHPDHLFATLECKQLEEYRNKLSKRDLKANRYWQDTLVGNHPFVQVKRNPPFSQEQEEQVYLNPAARAQFKNITRDFAF